MTDEQIANLKQAHPDAELLCQHFDALDIDVVFKVPSEGDWKRFVTDAQDGGAKRMAAVRVVVLNHVVFPDKNEFAELVARKPAIVGNIFGEIADAAGVSLESTVRKL